MALEDILPILPSFHFANDPSDPQAALALRQRIALQMMQGNKKAYPKTLGEGLSAIGDAIGEAGMARRLAQMDVEAQKSGKAVEQSVTAPPAAARKVSYAPSTDTDTDTDTENKPAVADVPAATVQAPMLATRQAVTPPATVPDNTPVRLNPDGTIAGNLTTPTQLPDQPQVADAPTPEPPPAPPGVPADKFRESFIKAYPERLAQAMETQRNNIAAAAMRPTAQGVPQPNPMLAGQVPASLRAQIQPQNTTPPPGGPPSDQRLAFNGLPPGVASDASPVLPPQITGAPKPLPQIAQAPQQPMTPQEMARMPVPKARYDYVAPAMRPPVQPPMTPQSLTEQRAQKAYNDNAGNPYAQQRLQMIMDEEKAKRLYQDAQNKAQYEADVRLFESQAGSRQGDIREQAKRALEGRQGEATATTAEQQNALRAQFGNLPPEEVFKQVNATQAQAKTAQQALTGIQEARNMVDHGIIAGQFADKRLVLAKVLSLMGKTSSGNLAADTEILRSTMQPIIASILHATSGTSQLSEGELAFAKAAAAGDIRLEPQSIKTLLTILDKRQRELIADHSQRVDTLFPDNPQQRSLFAVPMPPPLMSKGRVVVRTPEDARRLPRGTRIVLPDDREGAVP